MTKEQQRISNRNKKLAVEYFKWNGEGFPHCHLHHINPEWIHNDIERYIQGNPRDLKVMTPGEHTTGHNLHTKDYSIVSEKLKGNKNGVGPKSEEWKKLISEKMKGNQNGKGKKMPPRSPEHCKKISESKKGKHGKIVDGKRVYYE